MEHIGIDLGGRESQICVRAEDGAVLEERRLGTGELGTYLSRRPRSRVVMETCSEAFAVARQAMAAGHDVRVVPATLVRSLGVGARGIKTDVRDARVQSEASCRIDLPGVHIPSPKAQDLRSLLGMRDSLVTTRTKLVNSVRGYLRTHLVRVRAKTDSFPKRVREALLARADGLPSYIERHLVVIDALNHEIAAADLELKSLSESEPTCRLLMTAPGVGPVTAARFVSAVDDLGRFPSAHALESYLGLTPGEDSSSERQRRTGLTKAGPSAVRRCLVQASWSILLHAKHEPMSRWAQELTTRRPRQVAVCALARKLAGILYAMWRDNAPYRSSRVVAM